MNNEHHLQQLIRRRIQHACMAEWEDRLPATELTAALLASLPKQQADETLEQWLNRARMGNIIPFPVPELRPLSRFTRRAASVAGQRPQATLSITTDDELFRLSAEMFRDTIALKLEGMGEAISAYADSIMGIANANMAALHTIAVVQLDHFAVGGVHIANTQSARAALLSPMVVEITPCKSD